MANVFNYLDHRKFLKDMFEEKKQLKKDFSHRVLARMCGFKSSNYIMLVMQGKRKLSNDGIFKLSTALKLKKRESNYFANLVHFNQATEEGEKRFYYERIREDYAQSSAKRLESWQYDYYSKWYLPVIHEMVLMDSFNEDAEWIASRLNWKVTPHEIKAGIKTLFDLGLLTRDASGKITQAHPHITSGDDIASLTISQFQKEMILKGAESIDMLSHKDREIGSVTFAVSKDKMTEAKEMIREFRTRLAKTLSTDSKQETVCQFNIQFFGLINQTEEEK